ncbi:unnamed protein product [Paramecium pentaurelia]|uniref:Uncharacterized protein n=1 Tax=Paramecium pentaurelia TaxID=43138 RepID=A0A8S1XI38_9CILI|nr:unnamed protein product [Paramecium pentaurelia]
MNNNEYLPVNINAQSLAFPLYMPQFMNSQQIFFPFMYYQFPYFQSLPAQQTLPQPPQSNEKAQAQSCSQFVTVSGTRIKLNLKLIKELPQATPTTIHDENESELNNKQIDKHFKIIKQSKHIKRHISTRNVQVNTDQNNQPYKFFFRKNDGFIHIGNGHQTEMVQRKFNFNMMRMKLQQFQVWDHENMSLYDEIKQLMNLTDDKTLQILQSYKNIKLLHKKLMSRDPIAYEEVQNLLIKKYNQ